MKEVKLALIGFGDAGQAFGEMLLQKQEEIQQSYNTLVSVTAITTKTRGSVIDPGGIDLHKALQSARDTGRLNKDANEDSQAVVDNADYDVLVELTPLEFASGKTATNHIKGALYRGKHAITANKGPVAWAYKELTQLARDKNCRFLYETTVMDGAPIFNMRRNALRLCKVTGIKGILNSTTNYILCELAKGRDLEEIIIQGKERGFLEADPAADVEGYDASAKIAVLANVLMDADITPLEIERKGIEDITKQDIERAERNGNVIKLMCSAYIENGQVKGKVAPEEVSRADLYSTIEDTSSVITLTTDLMGTLSLIEEKPEVQQTAYGIFSDLMEIIEMN